jgi:hypothetical protein
MSKRPSFADYEPTVRYLSRGPMVTSASTEAPEPPPKPTVDQIELQIEKLMESNEFTDWFAGFDEVPQHSDYFGPISNIKLLYEVGFKPEATPEQCKAVFVELRKRFVDDFLELITERAETA